MSEAPIAGRRRRVRLALGLALTLVALGLVSWKVQLAPVFEALSGARPFLVVMALALALLGSSLASAEVAGQALQALGVKLSRRAVLGVTLENLSFQAALPFGAGHASRAFSLVRAHGVDPARAALSVPLVMGSKLAALLLIAAVGIGNAHPFVPTLAGVALAVAFHLARQRYRLTAFALFRALIAALVLTGLQITVFALLLTALGASAPLFEVLFRFPLCLVLAKLPITWMGFGTREAAVVTLFGGLADPGTLAAAALLFGVLDQIVPGFVGLAFTLRFARRILSS